MKVKKRWILVFLITWIFTVNCLAATDKAEPIGVSNETFLQSTWMKICARIKGTSDIFSVFLTPVIAILAVYIAWQQYRINRYKVRIDLFDRRYKIFDTLMNLLGHIAQRGDIADEKLNEFLRSTKESEFLFKKDIPEYLDEIYKNAVDLHCQEEMLKSQQLPIGLKRNEVVEKRGKIFDWFTSQFDISRKRFAKYLNFKNI